MDKAIDKRSKKYIRSTCWDTRTTVFPRQQVVALLYPQSVWIVNEIPEV